MHVATILIIIRTHQLVRFCYENSALPLSACLCNVPSPVVYCIVFHCLLPIKNYARK